MAAPPPLWQHEVASLGRDQTSKLPVVPISSRTAAAGMDGAEEKLSETWRHIKGVARDDAKQYDLMELVRNARREDTYQFPVPGVSICLQDEWSLQALTIWSNFSDWISNHKKQAVHCIAKPIPTRFTACSLKQQ
jgi:hypothetical protein